ncbi:hypothetical protein [Corynebacterium sputi]|uniref:hypothetical protein n=1 Tax=Corynebacterium sputi TaxID=489915 RepID=UPI0003F93569|nr:hypothetical protein [Corynebacterium sputi]
MPVISVTALAAWAFHKYNGDASTTLWPWSKQVWNLAAGIARWICSAAYRVSCGTNIDPFIYAN